MTEAHVVEYTPVAIMVISFLFRNKIFVTPARLQEMKSEILKEAESKFVTILVYQEFRHSNDKKMDELIQGVNDIKNFLMKKK